MKPTRVTVSIHGLGRMKGVGEDHFAGGPRTPVPPGANTPTRGRRCGDGGRFELPSSTTGRPRRRRTTARTDVITPYSEVPPAMSSAHTGIAIRWVTNISVCDPCAWAIGPAVAERSMCPAIWAPVRTASRASGEFSRRHRVAATTPTSRSSNNPAESGKTPEAAPWAAIASAGAVRRMARAVRDALRGVRAGRRRWRPARG